LHVPVCDLPPDVRTYRLVKLTGWSLAEIENTSAVQLDWLLAIDDVFTS
jgi:hypothetical protein